MTAVYIKYRPGDKVMIAGSSMEATVNAVTVRGDDSVLYTCDYWIDGEPNSYFAYDYELKLVESYVESAK